MENAFSVMTEPIIPVVFSDGTLKELGIRDVLIRAHEIRDVQCQSPLEEYAIFRLLVAISIDILRPDRWLDRKELFEKGAFDPIVVDRYIADCEKDGPRFNLFDPKFPFMQTAYEEAMDEKAKKPVAKLSVSLPSGNNHIFLDHRPENIPAMTPAEAFRALITLYLFCTAGAQNYPSGINNTPPVYTQIIGSNLYETIILNMVATREHPQLENGFDAVPWRNCAPIIPKQEQVTMTLMEGLTWQPRRACLFQDEDGMVRTVCLQQGRNFKGNGLWWDPHVAYKCGKKGEWSSIKPKQGKALWRDLSTVLADSANTLYRPPLTVTRASDILEQGSMILNMRQVGVVTDQASYIEWIEDRLSVPFCLLEDDLLAGIIKDDIGETEAIQGILVSGINGHYEHAQNLSEQARLSFLSGMHDVLFSYCIPNVYSFRENPTYEAIAAHIHQFHEELEKRLRETFRSVIQPSGNTAKDLQVQTEMQNEIRRKYRKLFSEREKRYE